MNIRTLYIGPFSRVLCVLLAVVMATGPSVSAVAQTNAAAEAVRQRVEGLGGRGEPQPGETPRDATQGAPAKTPPVNNDKTLIGDQAAGKIDTTYVIPGAIALISLRPSQILKSPLAQWLPVEVATAAGLKYLGIDPADVDEVVAFAGMPSMVTEYGLTIKFSKPFKGSAIPQQVRAHTKPGDLGGRKYLQSGHPMLPSLFAPDAKTLVVAPDATLQQLVTNKDQPKSGPLLDRIATVPAGHDLYAMVDIATIRPLIAIGMAQAAQRMPPEAQQLLEAPNLISAAELTVNLSNPGPSSLLLHANDEQAAQQLETLMSEAQKQYQEKMKAELAAQAQSDDPIQQALAKYSERMSAQTSDVLRPVREGASMVLFRTDGNDPNRQQLVGVAVVGILVALLLPAVQASREAARRAQSMNNLRNLILAMLNYESARKTYPAQAIYSKDGGQPLLSWRVAVLPYLEEQALYDQFHKDEPWDSPHNRELIARMPEVFKCQGAPLEPGKTNYLAVVGDPCIVTGKPEGTKIRTITDGTSRTIVLVEANPERAVEWTKPDDFQYDPSNPAAGLGGLRPGGWNSAFADGSVRFISNTTDPQILNALFTRNGGEPTEQDQAPPERGPGDLPRSPRSRVQVPPPQPQPQPQPPGTTDDNR